MLIFVYIINLSKLYGERFAAFYYSNMIWAQTFSFFCFQFLFFWFNNHFVFCLIQMDAQILKSMANRKTHLGLLAFNYLTRKIVICYIRILFFLEIPFSFNLEMAIKFFLVIWILYRFGLRISGRFSVGCFQLLGRK